MLHRVSRTFFFALLAALAACGGDSSSGSAVRVTRADSAGVEIVTTETPADQAPVFARLDSLPALRIGSVDGPVEEQFGSVRDLAPLSDGGVAVLDGQVADIRVFGPDGTFLRTVGHKGEGPGELSNPGALARLAEDSLAVWDYRTGRITVFTPSGALGREATVAFDGYGRPFVASFFTDGRMVGQSRLNPGTFSGDRDLTFVQDSAVLVVNAADGSLVDTVDVLPSRETLQTVRSSGNMVSVSMTGARFGRSNVFAGHPEGVWSGFGDHWELRLFDAQDAHLKRILRAPGLDRPLTTAAAEEVIRASLAEVEKPEDRRAIEQVNELSPRPELRPAYDRLVVDDQGRLWLRGWEGTTPGMSRWWVFGPDAALLGYVDMPGRFRLIAVTHGQAWGVTRDDLDVSYVVRYVIEPGEA